MRKIYNIYKKLSKQIRDSLSITIVLIGSLSTVMSIVGITLKEEIGSVWLSVLYVIVGGCLVFGAIYFLLGTIFKEEINLKIRMTDVCIKYGDIFEISGQKVIGCDTHFDMRIDDVVIRRNSLHGQLILNHVDKDNLRNVIETKAKSLGIKPNEDGSYSFPLGTVIRYQSNVDDETYLLLALINLNSRFEAHTDMAAYEYTLMKMWREIDSVYAMYDVVLPVLGSGSSRFDDGPKEDGKLLRCMLCTLDSSGVNLKSKVTIVLYGDKKKHKLYEYKDIYEALIGRKG